MKIEEYAAKCRTFVTMQNAYALDKYLQLGFIEEVGELSGKFAKIIRAKGKIVLTTEERFAIAKELGDICWFAAMLTREFNFENLVRYVESRLTIVRSLDKDRELHIVAIREMCFSLAKIASVATTGLTNEMAASCFNYVTMIAGKIGFTLDEILQMNIDKLTDRQNRGVINGDGDNR